MILNPYNISSELGIVKTLVAGLSPNPLVKKASKLVLESTK